MKTLNSVSPSIPNRVEKGFCVFLGNFLPKFFLRFLFSHPPVFTDKPPHELQPLRLSLFFLSYFLLSFLLLKGPSFFLLFLFMGLEIEKWDFIFGSKCWDLKIRDFWDWYFGRGFGVWLFLWGFYDVGLGFVMAMCCVLYWCLCMHVNLCSCDSFAMDVCACLM